MDTEIDTGPSRRNLTLPCCRVLPYLFMQTNTLTNLRYSGEWIIAAALVFVGVSIAGDFWLTDPVREFNVWGIYGVAFRLMLLFAFIYLVEKLEESPVSSKLLASLIIELLVITSLLQYLLYIVENLIPTFPYWNWLGALGLAWFVAAVAGLLLHLFSGNIVVAKGYFYTFLVVVILPTLALGTDNLGFWYQDYRERDKQLYYENYLYDDILYAQDELVAAALDPLPDGDDGRVALFYLGFASYASQNVFKHEVDYLDQLFKEKFHGAAHGLILNNHPDTIEHTPLAIRRNLKLALNGLGQKMGKEDILFIYLTSHGSKTHELAISFFPFKLGDLTPSDLKQYLDDSGILWRVVVVSACYSGGYVEDLAGDYTLVATAASATDASFGCDNHRDFTYFGEALLKDNLAFGKDMVETFNDTLQIIRQREKAEEKKPSNPQLLVGDRIKSHLWDYQNGQTAQGQ